MSPLSVIFLFPVLFVSTLTFVPLIVQAQSTLTCSENPAVYFTTSSTGFSTATSPFTATDTSYSCSPSNCQWFSNDHCGCTDDTTVASGSAVIKCQSDTAKLTEIQTELAKLGCNNQCDGGSASNGASSSTSSAVVEPELCSKEGLLSLFGPEDETDTNFRTDVVAAYCTSSYLVIWSKGMPRHKHGLAATPKPPGVPKSGGGGGGYTNECVGRAPSNQMYVYKIPLKKARNAVLNYELSDVELKVWGDASTPGGGTIDSGAVGFTFSGVPIYPALDNNGCYACWVWGRAWDQCEAGGCNAHVGRGGDYHYHGDPFGPDCLYTESLFRKSNDPHSFLLGLANDGFSVFGRYVTNDGSVIGDNQVLDVCGGHKHNVNREWGVGKWSNETNVYHYHSYVSTTEAVQSGCAAAAGAPNTINKFFFAPKSCYRGRVDGLESFYESGNRQQVNYETKNVNDFWNRNDLNLLRPCCSDAGGVYWGRKVANGFVAVPNFASAQAGSNSGTVSGAGSAGSAAGSGTSQQQGSASSSSTNTGSSSTNTGSSTSTSTQCIQAELQAPTTTGNTANMLSLSCSDGGTLSSFNFIAMGRIAGRCSGNQCDGCVVDQAQCSATGVDSQGQSVSMEQAVLAECQGKTSCQFDLGTLSFPCAGKNKAKVEFVCIGGSGGNVAGVGSGGSGAGGAGAGNTNPPPAKDLSGATRAPGKELGGGLVVSMLFVLHLLLVF